MEILLERLGLGDSELALRSSGFYGNTFLEWLIALGVAIGVFLLLRLVLAVTRSRVKSLSKRFKFTWVQVTLDLLHDTRTWFLLVLALFCGSLALELPEKARTIVSALTVVILLIQAGLWGSTLLQFGIQQFVKERAEDDAASVTTVVALGFLGKLAIWTVVLLLALDNLGVEVTALVAGLGVGGIAVGLAAQNILGDLFASLSIVLDKPFVIGDFIAVGDFVGSVENIGLKTTRLRSLSGEQLVFSNNDLLQSRVRNYKRMAERRIAFSIGVTYQTSYEKATAVPGLIRESIEPQESVRFDRVHFKSYGDFALIFEAVYYVLTPDYAIFMDVQQAINFELMKRFEQEQIEFAYPTQTIFLKHEAAGE